MDDLISRRQAIDAVNKNTFRLTFAEEQNCEGHVAWSAEAVYSDVMEGALLELPSANQTIYGYDSDHLRVIAEVLRKENLSLDRVAEAIADMGKIVAIVRDEFEQTLRRTVEQCKI